ncbi:RHS repeat-associated core domain-containing protein, partial [Treponema bryantii]
ERKSRIRERDLHIYTKQNETDGWSELTPDNWYYVVDPKNQSIHFNLKTSLKTRFIKIRTIWDDRDLDNNNVSDYVTFSNDSVQKMIRIWTLENERNEAYKYDGNSNRKIITENGKNRSYTYYKNDKNCNTARVMSDGKWYYTYDDNGNRTAKGYKQNSDNDKVVIDETRENWEYTWDYHNRLVKVQQFNAPDNAQNVCVEYTYDANNHRIERISKTNSVAETTQYAYGRNGALTYQKKTSGSAVTTRCFVYLNNQIAGFMDKTETGIETIRYAVTDIQGSVTEVYDDNNQLVWKSGYTAFGIKAGETTKLLDFEGLYTGCDYDVESGLTYHWNRWRSEDGESWLSEDPIRDGINWFGYAGQNPINYLDSTGLKKYKSVSKTENNKSNKNSNKQEENQTGGQTGPTGTIESSKAPDAPVPNLNSANGSNMGESKESYTIVDEYSNGNTTVMIMADGTINVKSTEPTTIIVVTYDNKTNEAGAEMGTMDVYSADPNSVYNSTSCNVPDASVPIVSGSTNASAYKTSVTLDKKQESVMNSGNSVLRDSNHGGSSNTMIRLDNKGNLIHQGNINGIQENGAHTAGCIAVTQTKEQSLSQQNAVVENYNQFKNAVGETNVVIIIR